MSQINYVKIQICRDVIYEQPLIIFFFEFFSYEKIHPFIDIAVDTNNWCHITSR